MAAEARVIGRRLVAGRTVHSPSSLATRSARPTAPISTKSRWALRSCAVQAAASQSGEHARSILHSIAEERARWAALRGDSGAFGRHLREAHAKCLKAAAHRHARRLATELAAL